MIRGIAPEKTSNETIAELEFLADHLILTFDLLNEDDVLKPFVVFPEKEQLRLLRQNGMTKLNEQLIESPAVGLSSLTSLMVFFVGRWCSVPVDEES